MTGIESDYALINEGEKSLFWHLDNESKAPALFSWELVVPPYERAKHFAKAQQVRLY